MQVCNYTIRSTVPKILYDDITKLFDVFDKQGIPIFARDGFLLGIIRHKGFLPFDVDPDVAILAEDYKHLKNLKLPEGFSIHYQKTPRNIKHMITGVPYEFKIKKTNSKHTTFLNIMYIVSAFLLLVILFLLPTRIVIKIILVFLLVIFVIVAREISFEYLPIVLDGTIFQTSDNENYYQEIEWNEKTTAKEEYGNTSKVYKYSKSDIKPLRKSEFYDTVIYVPNNAELVLKKHYGDNVFDVMFKKEDAVLDKIDITNCIPLPATLEKI